MEYKYCKRDNFENFACGRVIYYKSGMPNFPVRLAQEIFGRCLNYLENKNNISIYDPCSGGGYLLTVLGFLNMSAIDRIIGSDINCGAVNFAASNLALLTEQGLRKRISELENLYEQFHKPSHEEALESAKRILSMISLHTTKPSTTVFQANILSKEVLANETFKADMVITDVPYGNLVSWQGINGDAADILLENIIPVLKQNSVVAICSDKNQKIKSDKYRRLEKQQIGKRKFEILTLKEHDTC